MIYLTLLILPLFVILGFFLFSGKKITWNEFLIQIGVQCAIVCISVGIIYYSNLYDTEIWNGQVIGKEKVKVSCRHSYSCNCHEVCSESCDSDGDCSESCSEYCDTCYEHSHDFDWNVYSNIGADYTIDPIDRQGLKEPPRWTEVIIGEPVSIRKSFSNYIKASSDTLFRKKELRTEYSQFIPAYPNQVYDYYKLNRVLLVQTDLTNLYTWNQQLSELNGELGPLKESNIILIFTNLEKEFSFSVEQNWLGGKKNDIIIITGLKENKIDWVYIIAWCENDIFKVKLRDSLLLLSDLDSDKFFLTIQENVLQYYRRKSFKNFKYLATSITPTVTEWLASMLIGLIFSIGLSIYMYKNEYN